MKARLLQDATRVEYFDTVRRRLLDIPWSQRQVLLTDLLLRLEDLPPRTDPRAVLGDGHDYARLMREAAGYGPDAPRRFAYLRAWRTRRKILVAAAVLVTVVVVPAAVLAARWRAHYQPLDASLESSGTTAARVRSDLPLDTDYYRYRLGALVVSGVDLRNTGRVTVTVTGFVVPHDPYGPLVPTELRVTHDPRNCCEWQLATHADRISVRPGEDVTAFVVMKMVPWRIDANSTTTQGQPTLRVEVMGEQHLLPIVGNRIGITG